VRSDLRRWLEHLEAARPDELVPPLAFLAAPDVGIEADELRAARRRALLLLAAGGDPARELDPGGRAVRSVADDLDTPGRRAELERALARLREAADGLPRVAEALDELLTDGELAWRSLAAALLAEEVAGDD
jgi:hypothetical protein